ncbi:uncharacterized protein [Coffea arabica]|uniref:Uncharacterized protein n=1 Tax=Coffea arabica TaxID=13443 RepID=A0A6P6TVP5_COFAR|nr:uncharacterized protein LOC113704741 [Coffea arabica]
MVAGDFNVISKYSEQSGRTFSNEHNIEEFNDTMFNCGLVEVDFDGSPFTWTNGTMWQRLDRALVKETWSNMFGVTKVSHLVRGFLIPFSQYLGKTPDLFGNDTRSLARTNTARGMHGFFRKLVHTKTKFRQWNAQCFGNIAQAVKLAEEKLHQCESEFQLRRDDVSKSKAWATFTLALAVEDEFWRQKSAIKWIQVGDANTRFFHSVVKQRRNANFIFRIKRDNGHWIEDESRIKDLAT